MGVSRITADHVSTARGGADTEGVALPHGARKKAGRYRSTVRAEPSVSKSLPSQLLQICHDHSPSRIISYGAGFAALVRDGRVSGNDIDRVGVRGATWTFLWRSRTFSRSIRA